MKLIVIAWGIGLGLAGCATRPVKELHVVEIVSSKPYRFVTYSLEDTAETRKQVRAHNRAHQATLDAEKAANK